MVPFTLQGRNTDAVKEVEGVSDDAELGLPFQRTVNLVWIKENSLYRETLDDLEKQKKSLNKKVDRREKRVEDLTNQVYNVIGFFSVFQGVILTAVTQLTSSTLPNPAGCPERPPICSKVWFPVVLSALAAIAAVVGIGIKFRQLYKIDRLIQIYKLDLREVEKRESRLQAEGEKFQFKELKERGASPVKTYWLLKAIIVIGAVTAFSTVFIMSYFVIFCDKLVIRKWHS